MKGKKLLIEDCHKLAESKGGKCLSTEYINAISQMKWECAKGHIWNTFYSSIKQGTWCPECSGVKRIVIQDCHKLAELKSGKCLSTEFINSVSKLTWQCSKGHIWNSQYHTIRKGNWCPKCNVERQRHTIEDCHKLAQLKVGKCLSTEYTRSKDKMKWQCEKGHIWNTSFDMIKRGHWCPECAGIKKKSIEDCHKLAESKGGKFLSPKYLRSTGTIYEWQCSKGHIWKTGYGNIQSGQWCPECAGLKKKTIEHCHKLAESKGGKCLSTEYINTKSNLKWECENGHTFNLRYNDITSNNKWCRECIYVIEEIEGEIWKDIPNLGYMVSNFGRVITIKSGIKKLYNLSTDTKNNHGYHIVIKLGSVHRWVAKLFIENPLNKPYVNHIDGNKINNHVSNLEWCTAQENVHHAITTGLRKVKKIYQINKNTDTIIKEWDSVYLIGEGLNIINSHYIHGACKKRFPCFGYKWRYKDEYDQELQDKKTTNNGSN